MAALFRLSIWSLSLWASFAAIPASGLVIYRLGGEALDPPPEADQEGVEFIQLSWTNLEPSLGGKTVDLDIDTAAIRPLERDPNFNIAPGIEEHGGEHVRPNVNVEVWDGDVSVAWVAASYLCGALSRFFCVDDFGRQGTANINLGSPYLIDRIRIISGLTDPSKIVRTFRIYIAPELPWKNRSLIDHPPPYSPWVVEVRDNREQIIDIPLPPQEGTTFVQVAASEHREDWEVNEIEIYAKGFVEQSTYISNILDFGQPMAWGNLRWSGHQDPKARVFIQTRSGQDDDPDLFWRFTGRGDEKTAVSRSEYADLAVGEKAGIGYDQANWTFWSAPYAFADSSGTPIVSLSPRRYLQLKVDFLPQDDDGGQVNFLEVHASPPVATQLVGEVWPVEAAVGQPQQFTYVVRPTLGGDSGGFDRLEVATAARLGSVIQVRIGDEPVDYAVEEADLHRLVVSFPRLTAQDSGALVEVVFEAEVLRYGSTFSARVWDSALPLEVPQSVQGGDASPVYEGNRVWVATKAEHQGVLQVRVAPTVLTPNGDGRNDTVGLGYDLLELTGPASVEVALWDLSGRRVRQVYAGRDDVGAYERMWDGRDESGRLVPPGLYLYRVSVEADHQTVQQAGLLHVVY
ncbi:MAG: hypothetical protein F4Z57_08845 [Gemmatimonadetes bacterium]|nr:hypothetical protein [Gemmatimonadota bacterium]MYC73471.1 hypothetical protein [Gemmatimonadota bacterium]